MKKILLAAALCSNLLAGIDFTSFKHKQFTPLVSADSPGALSNLYAEQKWIHDTHKKEIKDLERIKLLIQGLYVENKNLIFELERLNELTFNYVNIKYEKIGFDNE